MAAGGQVMQPDAGTGQPPSEPAGQQQPQPHATHLEPDLQIGVLHAHLRQLAAHVLGHVAGLVGHALGAPGGVGGAVGGIQRALQGGGGREGSADARGWQPGSPQDWGGGGGQGCERERQGGATKRAGPTGRQERGGEGRAAMAAGAGAPRLQLLVQACDLQVPALHLVLGRLQGGPGRQGHMRSAAQGV